MTATADHMTGPAVRAHHRQLTRDGAESCVFAVCSVMQTKPARTVGRRNHLRRRRAVHGGRVGQSRLLARRHPGGPFKAQNMSNNSVVTVDGGRSAGRRPCRRAAGLAPQCGSTRILLKPGSDRTSGNLVVPAGGRHGRGSPTTSSTVTGWPSSLRNWRPCEPNSTSCCEGAGSRPRSICGQRIWPTWDLPAPNLPVVVVGISTAAASWRTCSAPSVLSSRIRHDRRVAVNKFRGDPTLLAPGLEQLAALTGRPTFGVLPYSDELWLTPRIRCRWLTGDLVEVPARSGDQRLAGGGGAPAADLQPTDIEALACEPGVGAVGRRTWRNSPTPTSW